MGHPFVSLIEARIAAALTVQFPLWTFAGTPITEHAVAIVHDGRTVWSNSTVVPLVDGPRMSYAEYEDPFGDNGWATISERLLSLDGPWLHEDSNHWDSYAITELSAGILVGCVDRERPLAGRPRFDRETPAWSNNLGVVRFPVVGDWLACEMSAVSAGSLIAAATVASMVIHETYEQFQIVPGVPVVDPHTDEIGSFELVAPGIPVPLKV